MISGVTDASAEAVSDNGARTSSGWSSPLSARTAATPADAATVRRFGAGRFLTLGFLATGFFAICSSSKRTADGSGPSRSIQAIAKVQRELVHKYNYLLYRPAKESINQ